MAGRAAAHVQGVKMGCKPLLTAQQVAYACKLVEIPSRCRAMAQGVAADAVQGTCGTDNIIAILVILYYDSHDLRIGAMTMNVSLTPQLEELVKRKVASGLYGSASEVMREALRLLEEHDRLRSMRVEELRAEIQKGLDSGEATPLDIGAIKARGRKRLANEQQKA